jgi:hypothetical protein
MKYLAFLLISLAFGGRCSNELRGNGEIVSLEFFYIPWEVDRESTVTESELRDLNDPLISYYCTREPKMINEFVRFFDIKQLNLELEIGSIEPYMIVDINYSNGKVQKLIAGKSMFIEYEGRVYSILGKQRIWLRERIPQATSPIGLRMPQC